MRRLRSREVLAYAVLVAVALGLRLYDLGDRPFHHDESQDAYFSWILFKQGDYAYNPLLHGPLRFYLTATMYALFGDSDFTARLAPALMGTAMVAMPYFLRRQLGRVAAFTAAVLLAIGPSYLYFSRFAREDIYFAAISLALLVVVFRFLDEPRRWHPALIGALIALGFATKETMYIAGFVAFTFFAILLVREGRGGPTRTALRSVGWEACVWALAAFAAIFTLMFTVFLTNPAGLWDGLYESLAYWLGQHDVGRGGEKPYFYVVVLFGDEWPVLLLGARRRRRGVPPADRPARVPGLGLRAVAGDLLVGGREVRVAGPAPAAAADPARGRRRAGAVGGARHAARDAPGSRSPPWRRSTSRSRRGGRTSSCAPTRASCWSPRSPPRRSSASPTRCVAMARKKPKLSVTVDSADGATFPYAWYFRDLEVGYLDLCTASAPPPSDVLVMTEQSSQRLAPQLGPTTRAASRSASGGCATTPRPRRRVAALHRQARGLEPHRRHARVPLREARRHQRQRRAEPGLARHRRDAPPGLNRVLRRPDERPEPSSSGTTTTSPHSRGGSPRAPRPRGSWGRAGGRPSSRRPPQVEPGVVRRDGRSSEPVSATT